jgi:glycosyltransferase involved in cell wall biosynthesis
VRIAFYAPLKAPTHPLPSGDRRMARLLVAALERAGHEVMLASSLRSRDGAGDVARQRRLRGIGARLAGRILSRHAAVPPDLWFTYHLYDRAPDWIGPRVAEALLIPYVVAEASVAPRRANGQWRIGHEAVVAALARADAVIGINSNDRACVEPLLQDRGRYHSLKPFLEADAYPMAQGGALPTLIAVGMMRAGDKLASYRVLGAALARLLDRPWRLVVVGDGPARAEVEAALAPLDGRVDWRGALLGEEIPALLREGDLFLWPAVNEAYGMALLEAQAAGLPVIAGRTGGVGDIVRHGETGYLVPVGDEAVFAASVAGLLADPATRRRMGAAARARVRAEHDIGAAAASLDRILRQVTALPVGSPL